MAERGDENFRRWPSLLFFLTFKYPWHEIVDELRTHRKGGDLHWRFLVKHDVVYSVVVVLHTEARPHPEIFLAT